MTTTDKSLYKSTSETKTSVIDVYVTKYGKMQSAKAEVSSTFPDMIRLIGKDGKLTLSCFHKGEWYTDCDLAAKDVKRRLTMKVATAERALERAKSELQNMQNYLIRPIGE